MAASGQILREYLVVAPRPMEANGVGLDVHDATANVSKFLRRLHLYDETEAVARCLRQLILTYCLRGTRPHDANVVATMTTHGIRTLITEDSGDFTVFDEIDIMMLTDFA